jgi:hydrogenase maturation factor HypF (carbamoyltransferase family)
MITSEIFHKIKIIVIGFLFGAILLIAMSVVQKIIVGHTPLLHKECIILVLFGGFSGSLISHLFKIKTLNTALQQRVNNLESVLPICSYCKKIRNPETDWKDPNSWQNIESYITNRTASQFTHGICPDCMKNLHDKKYSIKPKPTLPEPN